MDKGVILQSIIDHYANGNKALFAKRLGVTPQAISTWIKRNTFDVDLIFAKCESLSAEFLLTGFGQISRNTHNESALQEIQENRNRKLIPFYDINAEAGTIQLSNMDAVFEPDEWIDAGDWFRDADSAMRVHGDSMFPVYKSGSIVVMREVRNKDLIVYGQDYMVQTSEYRVIKRIQKSIKVDCWLACSINNETWEKGEIAGRLIHEPFDVAIDSIIKIYRVLGCVTRNEGSRIAFTKNKE